MISRLRPLEFATLAFLAGLLPGLRFAPSPVGLVTLSLLSFFALYATASSSRYAAARGILLFVVFALVGGAAGAARSRELANDCRARLSDGLGVVVRGVLTAATASAKPGRPAPLVQLAQGEVDSRGGACTGAVRVRVPDALSLPAGSPIEGRGEWIAAQAPVAPGAWPGEPMFAGFVSIDTLTTDERPSPLRHPLLWSRGRAEERLARLFPGHFGLAEALLLGRRERLDPEIRDRFVRAGLVHLLAISGAHVALFAAMLLLVGTALRLSHDRVRAVTIATTWGYLALIGAPGSALRAGIMVSLALGARILQRPSATLPMVAAAGLALVAWDPRAILDPGVQLSFAGVAAILLSGRVPGDRLPRQLRRGVPRTVVDAVLLSAIAFVTTAPITAHHFGAVSPVAIVANLPAIPLTSLALVGVVLAFVVDIVAPPLAALVADGAALALDGVDLVARLAADAPFGYLYVPRPDWILWGVATAATLLLFRYWRAVSVPVRLASACGLGLSLALAWPAVPQPGGSLEIHFLDVGQGDAIAIRSPAGRWILIDAGPRATNFDAGERRVLPFLSSHSVHSLEALVLTHADADHIGGAAAVLRGIEVHRVVEPGLPVGKEMYLELLELAEQRGVQWARAVSGRSLHLDGVDLDFLWPEPAVIDSMPEANHASAVIRLRYGSFGALFTGDAPDGVERRLAAYPDADLASEILKAGHHGSATSTSEELLASADPELVVISAGRRNRYGHPAPEVLSRLGSRDIPIARTDLEGTISLSVSSENDYRWTRIVP